MKHISLAFLLVASVGACTRFESSGLSGAGSMRVEVEVYKGPLTQTEDIQVGELSAVLAETVRSLSNWGVGANTAFQEELKPQCVPGGTNNGFICRTDRASIERLRDALEDSKEIIKSICIILPREVEDYEYVDDFKNNANFKNACADYNAADSGSLPRQLTAALGPTSKWSPPSMKLLKDTSTDLARRIANVAAEMKSKAFRMADANVHSIPEDPRVRGFLATYGTIVSEYSNHIQSRLSVLAKQFGPPEKRAKQLPVSDYLRDASQTDFIHLYDWLNAAQSSGLNTDGMKTRERIRMAERLYGDYYWERINEVYASGQGEVSMAFIKDELGNWNLKSYSNDPSELLKGYRSAADATLQALVDVVGSAASGGATSTVSRAQELLGLANRIASGENPAAAPSLNLSVFKTMAARNLAAKHADYKGRAARLQEQINKAKSPPADDEKVAFLQEQLNALPRLAAEDARSILDNHIAAIAVLQQGLAGGAAPQ